MTKGLQSKLQVKQCGCQPLGPGLLQNPAPVRWGNANKNNTALLRPGLNDKALSRLSRWPYKSLWGTSILEEEKRVKLVAVRSRASPPGDCPCTVSVAQGSCLSQAVPPAGVTSRELPGIGHHRVSIFTDTCRDTRPDSKKQATSRPETVQPGTCSWERYSPTEYAVSQSQEAFSP